jgi:hypothetical protein
MLRILNEQMDWFAQKARKEFVATMADYLEDNFSDCIDEMSRADLLTWVSDATRKAEQYGVTTEPEVAQLILLLLLLGVDADETTPWVKDTLSDGSLYAVGKVRKLVRLAREQGITGINSVVVEEAVGA